MILTYSKILLNFTTLGKLFFAFVVEMLSQFGHCSIYDIEKKMKEMSKFHFISIGLKANEIYE